MDVCVEDYVRELIRFSDHCCDVMEYEIEEQDTVIPLPTPTSLEENYSIVPQYSNLFIPPILFNNLLVPSAPTQSLICEPHTPVKEKGKYACNICNITKRTIRELRIHNVIFHPNTDFYRCEVCYKSFSTTAGLTQHTKIHNVVRGINCNICKKPFLTKVGLTKHIKKVHSEGGMCMKCNTTTSNYEEMITHSSECVMCLREDK